MMQNSDQEEFWTSSAGPAWVTLQREMDQLLQPVLDAVLAAAALPAGARVLDIGCGTGASVAQAADHVGPNGHVTGLDIAGTMLALADMRLQDRANTGLIKADAQTHPFAPDSYDAMISRFGVMFFDDSVAALRNLARALVPGGTMTFATWGPARHNPYFMEPASVAADVLGPVPKVDRTRPGPFAFEQRARVTGFFQEAGLSAITAEQIDVTLTPPGDLAACADLCCRIGPADSALQYHEATAEQRDRLAAAIALRLARYETRDGVRLPAVINIYRATRPGD